MLSSKKNNGFSNNKQEVVSITYEEIGLFPRSFSRVLDRFLKQVFSDVEHLVIQEYRFYRYLFLTTVRSLLILFFVPFFINFLAKTYVIRPLTEYFWNTKQTEIFLNSYQEGRAFAELKDFEEKLYFESLIYPKERSATSLREMTDNSSTVRGQGSQREITLHVGNLTQEKLLSSPQGLSDAQREILQEDHHRSEEIAERSGLSIKNSSTEWLLHLSSSPSHQQCETKAEHKIAQGYNIDRSSISVRDSSKVITDNLHFFTRDAIGECASTGASVAPRTLSHALALASTRSATQALAQGVGLHYALTLEHNTSIFKRLKGHLSGQNVRDDFLNAASLSTDSHKHFSSAFAPTVRGTSVPRARDPVSIFNSNNLKSSLFVFQTREAKKNLHQRYQEKILALAQRYNNQSIEAITNFFGDVVSLLTLFYLLYVLEIQINITKSFLLEVFFGLDDSKKSLLILLITDLLVGYHSSNLWELFFEFIFNHYGFPESQTGIFLLVATLPVLLDVLFKYLIFRHLNRSSPATVATYHAMIE